MKYMKQLGIILAVTCVGEFLHYFLPLPIPGSIYGLVLMLVLLCTHVLHIEDVKETGEFLIEIMPMMFIPAAVGLLNAWGVLKPILIPVLVITVVSTVLVMVVTGLVTQGVMSLRNRRTSKTDIVISAEEAKERHERSLIPMDRRLRNKILKRIIQERRWRRDHMKKGGRSHE